MKDIKLAETCKNCGENITLMESVNTNTDKLMLVKRCLKCGNYPLEEVAALAMIEDNNCNNCEHISMTEQEQTDKNIPHICLKHKVRVFHSNPLPKIYHGYLYPCDECSGNDFKRK